MKRSLYSLPVLLLCISCAMQGRLKEIRDRNEGPALGISEEKEFAEEGEEEEEEEVEENTDGSIIMAAIEDEDGDMVATETLHAAKVVARFRNVAERNGRVSLSFDINVPASVLDSKWQLCMTPILHCMGDSTTLEPVIVTGTWFRQNQLRGYEQYRRFLSSIASDSTRFIMAHQLNTFVRRNLPGIYRFRNDSSIVSDSVFRSAFGVTGQEAARHYTRWLVVQHNMRKLKAKDRKFRRFVRTPLDELGCRIDTLTDGETGDMVFRYVHTMGAPSGLRKAELTLRGCIRTPDGRENNLPYPEKITFYISSLSSLADTVTRYRTVIVERRVSDDAVYNIGFLKGKADVDTSFPGNAVESARIRKRLLELMTDSVYDLDSIVVSAGSSPEGSESLNRRLASERARAVSEFFGTQMAVIRDSLNYGRGVVMDMDGKLESGVQTIAFDPVNSGEDWKGLTDMVMEDGALTEEEKGRFTKLLEIRDPDRREAMLKKEAFFRHVEECHYPLLRRVRFGFYLHRKGMVKDTLHTHEPDSSYMEGVKALQGRDYALAESLLRPYRDYNSALAHCAMNHVETALAVLEECREDARAAYLKAILHARKGNMREAEKCLRRACSADRTFISRANLDPELGEIAGKMATMQQPNDQ